MVLGGRGRRWGAKPCCKPCVPQITRQVHNLFQDLSVRYAECILVMHLVETQRNICQNFRGNFRGGGRGDQNGRTDFENSVTRPVFHG